MAKKKKKKERKKDAEVIFIKSVTRSEGVICTTVGTEESCFSSSRKEKENIVLWRRKSANKRCLVLLLRNCCQQRTLELLTQRENCGSSKETLEAHEGCVCVCRELPGSRPFVLVYCSLKNRTVLFPADALTFIRVCRGYMYVVCVYVGLVSFPL